MTEQKPESLRHRLLIRLTVPLLGLMLIGGVLSFAAARYFAALVHDQWLYDSAMSLGSQVTHVNGEASLTLPSAALEMFEWDRSDKIYYEVASPRHPHIFGNTTIALPLAAMRDRPTGEPVYFETMIDGVPVRASSIVVPEPGADERVMVTVAETFTKRAEVVRSIMVAMMPLEAALLILGGLLIWFTVTSTFRNLNTLSQRLARLDVDRLQPVSDATDVPAEVRPLVSALNQLIGRLANANEAQRRFVANAAHQLRTPLATMQVQTERALREADPKRQALALVDIQKAMGRLKHMTQQLLTLARAEPAGGRMLEMLDVDLAELTRDALEPWTDAAIAKAIDLGYDGPANGVKVRGEPQLLRELVANLVDNAIRYGRQGGIVTVHLSTAPVVIAVEDDGPGIPAAERNHVTERFYRLPSSSSGGSGLGLSIALEIASRHNATLSIRTPEGGRGTLVMVEFEDDGGTRAVPVRTGRAAA